MSLLFLVGVVVVTGTAREVARHQLPPEEDQGYLFAGVQLPDAASLPADRRCRQEGRGDHHEDAGGEGLRHRRRVQLC